MWLWLIAQWSVGWAAELARLPEVVVEVPAAFPIEALGEAASVQVLLEVGVDADGEVTQVVVVEPANPALDAAAVAAMADFQFRPAIDEDGAPVASKIQYAFRFERDEVPLISLEGEVRRIGVDEPIAGVVVVLTGPTGQERTTLTLADGAFRVAGLELGAWSATATLPGQEVEPAVFTVREGGVAQIRLYARVVRAWEVEDVEVVEVIGRRTPPDITERPLRADEIRVLPGSGGDIVRAVQNLPGVGRTPLGIGQLIIRGAAPEDSRYSVDGMDVPLVFHFTGLTTVMPSDLLEEVIFLPGHFGARYGRNLGGRVELRTTSALPERTRGTLSVDLFQAAALVEVRASAHTAVTLAARRSYIDAVLTPLLSGDGDVFRAPRYYDAQLRVAHRWGAGATFDALVLFSDDRFVTGEEGEDGEIVPQFGLSTTFGKLKLRVEHGLGGGWRHEVSALAGPDIQAVSLSEDELANETRWSVDVRDELSFEAPDGDRLRVGLDIQSGTSSFLYDVERFGPREQGDAWTFAPALYIEPTWVEGPATLTAGLRTDLLSYGGQYTAWSVDPRLAARFQVGRTTALTAAVGRYTQFPLARQVLEEGDGTPGLKPPWALQSGVGIRQTLPYELSLEANVYFNRMFGLVVGREDRFRFFTTPPPSGPVDTMPYAAQGAGVTVGGELLLRWQSRRGLAWLSGTFGRSLRRGRDAEVYSPFAYDQRFVINALGSYLLPKQWRLGARVRVADGSSYTPVEQRVYALDLRGYIPLFGEVGSARLPTFFALDLRVDKSWSWKRAELTFYLDIQNVTNQRNVEVIQWTWDWAQETGIRSLPILPVFGLRGDWR